MKILRILLTCLALVAGLAVLAVLVLIAPAVQTWVAQHALSSKPGVTGTIGTLSAGFGEVSIEDIHVEANGAVLTLPSFQAKLSVTKAVLGRDAKIKSLVADGWTLDLSHATGAASAASARDVALLLGSLLQPWHLPADLSLDDVEMEGDVLLPTPTGFGSTHLHLRITGGGLAAGHEGTFVVETSGDLPAVLASTVAAHGNLAIDMDTSRTFSRVRLTAALTGFGAATQGNINLSAQADILPGGGPEVLSLKLARGDKELLNLATSLPGAAERLNGTWTGAVRDSDIAPFAAGHPLPSFSVQGSGVFDSDISFDAVHVSGHVSGPLAGLSAVWPQLGRTGTMNVDARFEAVRSSHAVHIVSLDAAFEGVAPLASVHALQAFDVDDTTASLKLTDPAAGWLDIVFTGLPLAWLPDFGSGVTLAGGDAKGEVVLTPHERGLTVKLKAPFVATGVSLTKGGRILAKGLDLSASLGAELSAGAWELRLAPLLVDSAGRNVVKTEGKFSRAAGDDQPVMVTGRWTGDILSAVALGAMPMLEGFADGTASGDFTASVTDSVDLQGNLLLSAGPGHSIASAYHVGLDGGGAYSFVIPLKIVEGKSVSDLSTEGTWTRLKGEDQIDLKVSGENVSVDHLLLVAGPLAAAGAGRTAAAGGERDATPFWGDWTGHVVASFDHLRLLDQDLASVGGVFDLDHGKIRLSSGHGGPEAHNMTNISGALTFDSSAAQPYSLKATSSPFEVDAKTLFAVHHSDELPIFEGHYSIAPSLVGAGMNLPDLAARTQGEFRISSSSGIVRLLKANVATSLHEKSAPVTDTLGTVGSAVGGFLGSHGNDLGAKNHLSKSAEAAIDVGNQLAEIGCDEITLVARRSSDGTFTISDIDMVATDEFLRGSGSIGAVKGLRLLDQPLSLDLRIGAKGPVGQLLTTAGISDPAKDSQGFTLVAGEIHFGGTLAHIDTGGWEQVLVKAANKNQ